MYAMDRAFWGAPSSDPRRWRTILQEAQEVFAGERIVPFNVEGCRRESFRICHNSGVGAIALAAHWRAERVILLGYDCKVGPRGQRHHHADHPPPLGNCGSINTWPKQFRALAGELKHLQVVNASRDTDLNCWPRAVLQEALEL